MAKRKKQPELRQWEVPFEWTLKGYALVEAHTEEEAISKAEALQHIELGPGNNGCCAEMTDWEVIGDPEPDE